MLSARSSTDPSPKERPFHPHPQEPAVDEKEITHSILIVESASSNILDRLGFEGDVIALVSYHLTTGFFQPPPSDGVTLQRQAVAVGQGKDIGSQGIELLIGHPEEPETTLPEVSSARQGLS